MAAVAVASFRLGGLDGVSVEAATWIGALRRLGHDVVTVAGSGPVDHLVPALAWPPPPGGSVAPRHDEVEAALAGADLVVVENLCSLPLHPAAAEVVAAVLAGRPALLHHYDLPWERSPGTSPTPAGGSWPPDDAAWAHVAVTDHARRGLAARGVAATTIRCSADVDAPAGDRTGTRAALGLGDDDRLLLHPVRAIARKAVPAAVALAEGLRATYWLTGPAEEGYGPTLAAVLAAARCPTLHRSVPSIADAYAACDAVALPSTWEGFGLPLGEAAVHRRPVAVGRFPAADELAGLGFRWFPADDAGPLGAFLDASDEALLDVNHELARTHLSPDRVTRDLATLLSARWGL